MHKYGGTVVCLDATYKTIDYALPLSLLVVKTPSAYVTAGGFVVQFRTAQSIQQALKIFKRWESRPKFWMVE